MPQLSDSDIEDIAGSAVYGDLYQTFAETAMKILVRERGRSMSPEAMGSALRSLSAVLDTSATSKIVRKIEELYEEEEEAKKAA